MRPTRRTVLDWLIGGGLVTWAAGIVVPIGMYLWPARKGGPGSQKVSAGKVAEWPEGGARTVQLHARPVIVIRGADGAFHALSAICTHLGCVVGWNASNRRIECPCHAAAFDERGRVLSGPPPAPLPAVEVTVHEGEVWVQG